MYTVYIYTDILIYVYLLCDWLLLFFFQLGASGDCTVSLARPGWDRSCRSSLRRMGESSIPTVVLYIWRQRLVQLFLTSKKAMWCLSQFLPSQDHNRLLWIPSQLGLLGMNSSRIPNPFHPSEPSVEPIGEAPQIYVSGGSSGMAMDSAERFDPRSPPGNLTRAMAWRRGRSKKGMGMTWDINGDILMGYCCVYIYNIILYVYYIILYSIYIYI